MCLFVLFTTQQCYPYLEGHTKDEVAYILGTTNMDLKKKALDDANSMADIFLKLHHHQQFIVKCFDEYDDGIETETSSDNY